MNKNIQGASVLLSLRYYTEDDEITKEIQFLGSIETADTKNILIVAPEGQEYKVPANYRALLHAPRGRYKCYISKEEIKDPDYLMAWNIVEEDWQPEYSPLYQFNLPYWKIEYDYDEDYLKRLILEVGEQYIGKSILVGRTYEYGNGQIRQEQHFGKIINLSYECITIKLKDESILNLPPDLTLIQPAGEGEYRLRATGEVIVDPDYLTMYICYEDK